MTTTDPILLALLVASGRSTTGAVHGWVHEAVGLYRHLATGRYAEVYRARPVGRPSEWRVRWIRVDATDLDSWVE